MLPLVGQKLALQDKNQGTALMSGCIVAAQVVMVPMAMLVGHKADVWGRKPLFLAGFAILSLRGFLYPLSDDRFWLFAVQSLDGVGAGLYGALFPLIVADLTRGTGHFNLAQGGVITAQGIGAALSTSLAGTRRCSCGLFCRISCFGRHSGFGISALFLCHAGDARDRLDRAQRDRRMSESPMSSASLAADATIAVFVLTYAGVAFGRAPGLRIDRAGIALVGASLMVALKHPQSR